MAGSESVALGPIEGIMTTKNRRTSGNQRYAFMPISLFHAANCYFHPAVLLAPFSSVVGCDRVGRAIAEKNDTIRIDPALLQDKVLYI